MYFEMMWLKIPTRYLYPPVGCEIISFRSSALRAGSEKGGRKLFCWRCENSFAHLHIHCEHTCRIITNHLHFFNNLPH